MINGVFCHETGCPSAWKDKAVECWECGCDFYSPSKYLKTCHECIRSTAELDVMTSYRDNEPEEDNA